MRMLVELFVSSVSTGNPLFPLSLSVFVGKKLAA
jgi:hypothetical protein